MMRSFSLFVVFSICFVSPAVHAEESHAADHSADHSDHAHSTAAAAAEPKGWEPMAGPPAGHLEIQVNGIVCSFCAHGLEKALSKLGDLDKSLHGNGVLVDIESQRVTLAFSRDLVFPFADIHRRIKKAGYDPVRFDFRIAGVLESAESGWKVVRSEPQALYLFADRDDFKSSAIAGIPVEIVVSLNAADAKDLDKGDAIPVRTYGVE